jgi:hypothetical protein
MKKPSQIAETVLEKWAIDLATLRRVSTDLLKRHGVRGGVLLEPGFLRGTLRTLRRPKPGKGQLFRPMPVGPAVDTVPRSTQTGGVVRLKDIGKQDPRTLLLDRGKIFSGGGQAGTFSGRFKDSPYLGVRKLPSTGVGKEVMNRIGLMHEGFEHRYLGSKGVTYAERARKWGIPVPSDTLTIGAMSSLGGHVDPRVILNEHNVVSTLPRGVERHVIRNALSRVRSGSFDPSWKAIQEATGRKIPYGKQRLSRHAIKRIAELMRAK